MSLLQPWNALQLPSDYSPKTDISIKQRVIHGAKKPTQNAVPLIPKKTLFKNIQLQKDCPITELLDCQHIIRKDLDDLLGRYICGLNLNHYEKYMYSCCPHTNGIDKCLVWE
eukprot:385722_1